MAERRMMAKSIIDSDQFLDLPFSTQALYFHLLLHADDDGFIKNPKSILRSIGAKDGDMKALIEENYVLLFQTGVIVIKHWKVHNYIKNDRYRPSDCAEKSLVSLKSDKVYQLAENGTEMEPDCIQDGGEMEPDCIQNGGVGKVRLGKVRLGKVNNIYKQKKKPFIPPTIEEVRQYVSEHNYNIDVDFFYEYYSEGKWHDSTGAPVLNWKQRVITWAKRKKENPKKQQTPQEMVDEAVDILEKGGFL